MTFFDCVSTVLAQKTKAIPRTYFFFLNMFTFIRSPQKVEVLSRPHHRIFVTGYPILALSFFFFSFKKIVFLLSDIVKSTSPPNLPFSGPKETGCLITSRPPNRPPVVKLKCYFSSQADVPLVDEPLGLSCASFTFGGDSHLKNTSPFIFCAQVDVRTYLIDRSSSIS